MAPHKIRCMIVDDEPLAIRVITLHLEQIPDVEVVASYTRALDAHRHLQKASIDLLFLDIHMPTLSGLDLIRSLEKPATCHFHHGASGLCAGRL